MVIPINNIRREVKPLKIKIQRVMEDIRTISSLRPEGSVGCTRFSFSEEDHYAREYVIREMIGAGAKVWTDSVGNIHGRIAGTEKEKSRVLVGSHLDTVRNGGPLDGLLGVAAGMEILRVFQEEKIKPVRDFEVIAFSEEEGSNFGATMLGSKCLTGKAGLEELKRLKNDEGISAYEVMKKFGLNPDSIGEDLLKPEDYHAMIELHIEQGQVLESSGASLGIVEGIFGMTNLHITLKGIGNHAGATPMALRRDPMAAAGRIIGKIPEWVNQIGSTQLVATVGKIQAYPNASNVIPEKVTFTVDIRDMEAGHIGKMESRIREELEALEKEGIQTEMETIATSPAVSLSREIRDILKEEAAAMGISNRNMYSGAVHDCAMFTDMTKVGLLFVPSIGGRSHVPEEDTKETDIGAGISVLLKAVYRLVME
jgi:hydantoinase/carbamoylase family amidase